MQNGECRTEIVRKETADLTQRRGDAEERLILETLRVNAERFRAELSEFFQWPMARILEDSPLLVAERDAEGQFKTWLIWLRD